MRNIQGLLFAVAFVVVGCASTEVESPPPPAPEKGPVTEVQYDDCGCDVDWQNCYINNEGGEETWHVCNDNYWDCMDCCDHESCIPY